ncbi:efflux RND transporter periplasmic adaptor subunit [Flammeovirga pacifica]|uniref:Uncharacterized protein n=1 Tax=Flammeovirga pacifica TaxID=915059 RepID=A0A1S1YU40_FLAPC|nr:efflux RND transporter periplasmic adaptor subunit [Flammeovirga pacifica]OHX64547.1 hypothetical protein NH26_23530 [Flammeovirga pacifica]
MKNTTIVAFFLTVLIFNTSCKEEKQEAKNVFRIVRYTEVSYSDLDNAKSYSGKAVADQEMELSFRSSGIITEKNVKVGQNVKQGELLMKLDNIQAKLTYEQSVAALNTAKSEMYTAKSEFERGRKLYEQGNYTLSKYQSVMNAFENASNQYASAERKLAIDKEQVRNGYIYAPKDAVVAEVNANLNETVSSGQSVILLNAGNDLNVEVGVPENTINNIYVGMNSTLTFKSIEQTVSGKVIEVSPILDRENATFPVKIRLNDSSKKIHPGMLSDVKFDFEHIASEYNMVLPLSAIGEDAKGNFVYAIKPLEDSLGTVTKQYIKVGDLTDRGVVINSGVEVGQIIVTAGLQTLISGQTVKL